MGYRLVGLWSKVNMRVISGIAKGRHLFVPKDPTVRPATDKVKEAIFSILGTIEELSVLDLFAGSGSIGIEALSRGAKSADFVEIGAKALHCLRKNIKICSFEEKSRIWTHPVEKVLPRLLRLNRFFDLVFVDPPYDKGLIQPSLELAEKVLAQQGQLIVENSPREPVKNTEKLVISDERKYGQTRITFLKFQVR
jgi:16S rRNA (guanine966-N2)-methyltransferase